MANIFVSSQDEIDYNCCQLGLSADKPLGSIQEALTLSEKISRKLGIAVTKINIIVKR